MKNKLVLTGMLSACLMGLNTRAQEQLDTLLIKAERIEHIQSRSTKTVTVVEAKELEEMPIHSLSDLMRHLPGVNVNSRGPFGVQTDIGLRGSTFSQVLVLLDGMRLTDPLTGHFNHALPIPLKEIERIEILKGPASAAYGADAVGGVVHIISKGFADKSKGLDLKASQAFGSYDLIHTDVGASYHGEKLSVGIGVKHLSTTGETHVNPSFDTDNSVKGDSLYNNDIEIDLATVNLGYRIGEHWDVQTRFAHDRRDFKAKYYYTQSSFDDSREATETSWVQGRVRHQKEGQSTVLNMAYRHNTDDFKFNPNFPGNFHTTERLLLNVDHRRAIGSHSDVVLGAFWNARSIESNDRGDHEDVNQGAYAIYAYKLSEVYRLQGGLRLENDENYGTELSPQLGLNYHKGHLSARAEWGRAIRAADYTERYIATELPNLSSGRNLGNRDLKAERSDSYSIGATYRSQKTIVDIDVFARMGKNLIDYVLTPDSLIDNADNTVEGASYLYTQNVSEVNTMGVEFALRHTLWQQKANRLLLDLSYTYLETEMPNGKLPTKYLANHPDHQLGFGLRYSAKKAWTSVRLNYIEREAQQTESIAGYVPSSYHTMDLDLGYKLSPEFAFFFRMNNVLDERYQEILGVNMPGRWTTVGFKLDLVKR